MTTLNDLLEDFGSVSEHRSLGLSDEEIETQKLESFEEGYKAGWDDAAKAQSKDRRNLSTDLSQNLLDLSFTYNEAYAHMIKGLRPLLTELTTKVLPEVMHATIGHRVVEEVLRIANQSQAGCKVVVLVPSENLAAVEDVFEQDFSFPVTVREDASLAPGQVQMRFDEQELELNLASLMTDIQDAIETFSQYLSSGAEDEQRDAI
ncbi:ABC transporter ATP-binding protein [Primorskyibacter aestuariivivens]|uniref:FliH/SctL family protein n=1 Tax=Primorskyibacter aestuariivivens TaxID=1888912 RepID=UPI002300B265|nr:ABC transporter ATP-binding protein [Primorskyibacter aestuariivivens]MDA7430266.1 ABC transporter ATP-binding protein [Primorskyibacter aestuariivivens]